MISSILLPWYISSDHYSSFNWQPMYITHIRTSLPTFIYPFYLFSVSTFVHFSRLLYYFTSSSSYFSLLPPSYFLSTSIHPFSFLFFSSLFFSFLSFPFQHLSDNTLGTFSLLTYFYSCRYIIRSNMSHKLFPFSCS